MNERATILVVDDKPENLRLLVSILEQHDYTIRPVRDGQTALSSIQADPPDLVLLDIMMPDLNGYEVCRRIKADEALGHIPVIFITALQETHEKIEGFRVGGVDYVTKPFQAEEVLARVQTHLELQRLHRLLKDENDRFRALEEASFEGVVIHEQGRIVDVNTVCVRMFDSARDEMCRLSVRQLLAPSVPDDLVNEAIHAVGESSFEGTARRHDGSEFPVQTHARAMRYRERDAGVIILRDLTSQRRLERENQALRASAPERYRFGSMIGKSQVMQEVYDRITMAAASDFTVLITGESGTGKELAARMIHDLSERGKHPFVAVNCGAIAANLFERELFGHRRGAFTGADRNANGFLDAACKGSLFLDEVAELLPEQQITLLRVLQEGEYIPIGGTQPKTADIRVLAATNQDLKGLRKAGRIRDDFYYRMHVLTITMPPLRHHKEDLPLLIDYFLEKYHAAGRSVDLPRHILTACYDYHWPGNIRELENEIQHYLATKHLAFVESGDLLDVPADLDDDDMLNIPEAIKNLERRYILRALEHTRYNRSQAADLLGIARRTLYEKMKDYQIAP